MKRYYAIIALLSTVALAGCGESSSASESLSPSSEISSEIISSEASSVVISSEAPTSVFTPLHPVPSSETTLATDYQGAGADAYYASIANLATLEGQDLALALRTKGKAVFTGLNYTQAIEPIIIMDTDQNNTSKVIGIYSRNRIPAANRQVNIYSSTPDYWNREHCFPQSKLKDGDESLGADGTKVNISSDIANLFAEDFIVNENRSNYSFAEIDTTAEKFFIKDSFGNTTDTYSWMGYVVPTDLAKGEVARANLYMILMYPDNCSLTENGPIETFLKWNREFPPTVERDILRNQTIYQYQHNRNPFIDDPDFGCRIWGNHNVLTRSACGL